MRPTARPLVALLVVPALLAVLAVPAPAVAKEGLEATLDAPIALGTPPGTEILVGVTVMAPGDDGAAHPVEGSPIRLILTGRYGATTHAAGAADGKPGHYLMRIVIPAGGVRGAVVAMHGTSDLPLMLTADPFTFGGVTPRTAQVAPPLAPPMTPFPRASAGAVAPAAPVVPAEAAAPGAVPPSAGGGMGLALGAGIVALLVLGLLLVARRSRGGRRAGAAARTPGA